MDSVLSSVPSVIEDSLEYFHFIIGFKKLFQFHPNFLSEVQNKEILLGYIKIELFQILRIVRRHRKIVVNHKIRIAIT